MGKVQLLSRDWTDYINAQVTGGVQTGVQTHEVKGGVDPVALTAENWGEQGFGVTRTIPGSLNLTLGVECPLYFLEDPKGHASGVMPSFGWSFSRATSYSLYSNANRGAGDDATADLESFQLTAAQNFHGPAFGLSYFFDATNDVSEQEKAVAEAKTAQAEGKKAVQQAGTALTEAKKGLVAPQAAFDDKNQAVTVLEAKIGAVGDDVGITPGTGLAGEVERLKEEIARIDEMPAATAAEKKAVAEARTALAPKIEKLKSLETQLATAQAELVTAKAALVAPQRVLEDAKKVVTEAEAAVTKAKAKMDGTPDSVTAARGTLAQKKVALETAEETYKKEKSEANLTAMGEASAAVKAAQTALNEALGLNNVLKEAEKALEIANDGNDAFTVSRAGLRYAPEFGVTTLDPLSAEGLNVERGAPATSFEPFTTNRHTLDLEVQFNIPKFPVDALLQVGLVIYNKNKEGAPVVQIEGSESIDTLTSQGGVFGHFAVGIAY